VAKPDDYSLADAQRGLVQQHARRALRAAEALGRFPTPIADVIAAANVIVADEDLLNESLLARFRKRARDAGHSLRRAISKVLGVVDVVARVIYLDRTIHAAKQTFLKLHETGHAVLPWQRDIFAVTEDCEMTLAPDIADQFEREASAFAADVVFQIDAFTEEANQSAFNILVPVRLSKRYGASIYMAVRRYVTENHRACAVLVLEPPRICSSRGFVADLRREVTSPVFRRCFGELDWPASFYPDDEIGALVPTGGRKMSRPRAINLVDRNGTKHHCMAEAFTQGHQVFILIHSVATLTGIRVAV
jgi:Zn-dependent peptidase ImmA (M78 family)